MKKYYPKNRGIFKEPYYMKDDDKIFSKHLLCEKYICIVAGYKGYKGREFLGAGYIYAPYITIGTPDPTALLDIGEFKPTQNLADRYSLVIT